MAGSVSGLLLIVLVVAVGYGVHKYRYGLFGQNGVLVQNRIPDPIVKHFNHFGKRWQETGKFDYSDYLGVLRLLDDEGIQHSGPVFDEGHLQEFFQIMFVDWGIPECVVPHPEDFRKPVAPLVKELGVDGMCHFGWIGGWLSETRAALKMKDWGFVAKKFGLGGLMFNSLLDIGKHPRGWANGELKVGPLVNVYDAKLCFDMGWYGTRFPADKIGDFEYWNVLGETECSRFQRLVPHFDNLTLPEFQNNYVKHTTRLAEESWLPHVLRRHGSPTNFDNIEHSAMKCALGGARGLAPDIANCAYNFCMLDAGYMGQGKQCRENWMPADFSQRYQKPSMEA